MRHTGEHHTFLGIVPSLTRSSPFFPQLRNCPHREEIVEVFFVDDGRALEVVLEVQQPPFSPSVARIVQYLRETLGFPVQVDDGDPSPNALNQFRHRVYGYYYGSRLLRVLAGAI